MTSRRLNPLKTGASSYKKHLLVEYERGPENKWVSSPYIPHLPQITLGILYGVPDASRCSRHVQVVNPSLDKGVNNSVHQTRHCTNRTSFPGTFNTQRVQCGWNGIADNIEQREI